MPGGEADRGSTTGEDPRIDVLGVPVSDVNPSTALDRLASWVESGRSEYVCVTGVHGVMESQDDRSVAAAHSDAGMVVPDGMPMVWSGRRAGSERIDRVYGPDFMLSACELAAARGWPVYLYGGAPGVAETLSERLRARFPKLEIAGTHSPPLRAAGEPEDAEVLRSISESGARIVWVGLSTPKQELWMANHLERIESPVVMVGVGAAFDINAGLMPDAPRWMQRSGLHWLYRLLREPRRLWRRYLRNNPRFVAAILRRGPRRVDASQGVDASGGTANLGTRGGADDGGER